MGRGLNLLVTLACQDAVILDVLIATGLLQTALGPLRAFAATLDPSQPLSLSAPASAASSPDQASDLNRHCRSSMQQSPQQQQQQQHEPPHPSESLREAAGSQQSALQLIEQATFRQKRWQEQQQQQAALPLPSVQCSFPRPECDSPAARPERPNCIKDASAQSSFSECRRSWS